MTTYEESDQKTRNEDLYYACISDIYTGDRINELIKDGRNIDYQDDYGRTPLMGACNENNIEKANILINNGANLELKNNHGETALFIAAHHDNYELCINLISSGCNNNIFNNKILNDLNETVVSYAEKHGNVELCKLLKDIKDDEINLLKACSDGDLETVKALINKGVYLDYKGYEGKTALMRAASDNPAFNWIFLDEYSDAEDDPVNIEHAKLRGDDNENREKIVELLIVNGANPDLQDEYGMTVFDIAARCERASIIALLDKKDPSASIIATRALSQVEQLIADLVVSFDAPSEPSINDKIFDKRLSDIKDAQQNKGIDRS